VAYHVKWDGTSTKLCVPPTSNRVSLEAFGVTRRPEDVLDQTWSCEAAQGCIVSQI
jgi:hypothetical protein